MTIKTKTELISDATTKFPDNNAQQITPADLRSFVIDFIESNLSSEPLIVTSTPVMVDAIVDLIVADAGADIIDLPTITDYKDRTISISNISGSTVSLVATGGDTIDSAANYTVANNTLLRLAPNPGTSDWVVVFDLTELVELTAFDEANALTTTIIVQSVYQDIDCALVANGVNNFFSISGNQLTYTGDIDVEVNISWSIGVLCAQNNRTAAFKVFKNFGLGSEVELDGRGITNAHTSEEYSTSLFTKTTLSTGDILHFTISNQTNTSNMTVVDQTINISQS